MKSAFFAILFILSFCHFALAQDERGKRLQNISGVAMVKPQAWSPPNSALPKPFKAFIDRRADKTPGAGYIEFVLPSGRKEQISSGLIGALVFYPSEEEIASDLLESEDRQRLQKRMNELANAISNFPSLKSLLGRHVEILQTKANRFDSSEVFINGKWIARSERAIIRSHELCDYAQKELNAVFLADEKSIAENSPGQYSIANTTLDAANFSTGNLERTFQRSIYVNALQSLAEKYPAVREGLNNLQEYKSKLVRGNIRKNVLVQLSRKGLEYRQFEFLVSVLNRNQPDEDPESSDFVKRTDASLKIRESMLSLVHNLSASLDKLFSSAKSIPDMPQELSAECDELARLWKEYLKVRPPESIPTPENEVGAILTTFISFNHLKKHLVARKLFDAKIALESIIEKSAWLGASTCDFMAGLNMETGDKIEHFQRLRSEGEMLLANGQTEKASRVFREALALLDDSDVSKKLNGLQ
jgi:hypothetical protein